MDCAAGCHVQTGNQGSSGRRAAAGAPDARGVRGYGDRDRRPKEAARGQAAASEAGIETDAGTIAPVSRRKGGGNVSGTCCSDATTAARSATHGSAGAGSGRGCGARGDGYRAPAALACLRGFCSRAAHCTPGAHGRHRVEPRRAGGRSECARLPPRQVTPRHGARAVRRRAQLRRRWRVDSKTPNRHRRPWPRRPRSTLHRTGRTSRRCRNRRNRPWPRRCLRPFPPRASRRRSRR